MAALAADGRRSERAVQNKVIEFYTLGTGATVYLGSLVAINESTGRAVAATAATARTFLGMAEAKATGNTAGTVGVKVSHGHQVLINAKTALTTAYTGCNAAVSTDNDVTTASAAGTAGVQVLVGQIIQFEGGDAWVALRSYSEKNAP